jgi:hypothetical protein
MGSERRQDFRQLITAEVGIYETATGTKLKARLADLSSGGCFLDMLNPSQEGTEVKLSITLRGDVLIVTGKVTFAMPNMGMGVQFEGVEAPQRALLEKWLELVPRPH